MTAQGKTQRHSDILNICIKFFYLIMGIHEF